MENQQKELSACRCPWLDTSKPDYVAYHDEEWGVPVYDDQKLFEFLCLESAQAGLSWYTILKRRNGYRDAFANFDVNIVAQYDQDKVEQLLLNPDIIRHRGKINAAINNAQLFIKIQQEFGSFSNYMWGFVDNKTIVKEYKTLSDYPATSPESDAWSKDLKKRGFKFVGSTICYAHMQACGMVNDHSLSCYKRKQIIDKYQQC
ncbi:DNA-3-methyladenine glycosylase I [Colwellia sp. 1_MG-2023]|uniref:DNA-3-methyladenine glycosylase I n=1 Tax=unclassified Colwellia TaxID=196834 RepID=UPI001C0880A0|nr:MULTISPECIES: DNA-3-methyladenine glycosylase I [unclassified Colwellia]MBU2926472.1 DNA-3-methyladenine glycosylase I [Colwellia sp. C2M11]MDO6652510.1 DNA-3-methyladenine glycosylase I [Colwellia sp. 3_MG-2023]MDO6665111.1 DNA-3-methyladenine glycosylase I [Colwellia sp. 2_MG-2023]MDO6689567.1 DNA-3-methyladenine glycosylase I [Colwellia sp. 1_MG-2023]